MANSHASHAWARLRSWLRSITHRSRLEAEMEAELASHLDHLTADLVRAGISPAEAARRARIALGSPVALKEEMRASLGLRWWDELQADLRYGARVLLKSRGATIVAAISLALAIGANVTIFSLTKQLLYTRLDAPHAEPCACLHGPARRSTLLYIMYGATGVRSPAAVWLAACLLIPSISVCSPAIPYSMISSPSSGWA